MGGTTTEYKSKIRSLFVNLKDKNNPALRESIVSGDLAVDKFAHMTSQVCSDLDDLKSPSPNLSIRTWLRQRGKPPTKRSSKKTFTTPWQQRNDRQRPMRSSARGANRYASSFIPSLYDHLTVLTLSFRENAVTGRLKHEVLMNR